MTQYNPFNIKLSNSKLNKLKSAIKYGNKVTSNLSSNLIGSSTNFPHKLLLTNTQVSKIRKAFANGSSANIKFSKTQLSKFAQSGGFIDVLDLIINPDKNPIFNPDKTVKKIINKLDKLSKKRTINDIIKSSNWF